MIKIFYHVYCANDRIFEIINDMICKIHFSNLYSKCESVYVFISGKKELIFQVRGIFENAGSKFNIVYDKPDDNTFERLTLENIHKYVSIDDKILYIHSKGVSSWSNRNPIFQFCVKEWVYFMTYFLIAKHELCIEKLNEFDTVGTVYTEDPKPHWSGNMWWVSGKYLLNLPTKIGSDYYDTEVSFLFQNNPKYLELSKQRPGYSDYIPKCNYIY